MAYAFHEGERAVQARAGEVCDRSAQCRCDHRHGDRRRPPLHREASHGRHRDPYRGRGLVWASLLFGPPGFLRSPEGPQHRDSRRARAQRQADDPFWQELDLGSPAGLLFIELSTRRRYRVNGRCRACSMGSSVRVAIDEAYPNCPKYIQRRHPQAPVVDEASQLRRAPRACNAARPSMKPVLHLLDAADTLVHRQWCTGRLARCLAPWRPHRLH